MISVRHLAGLVSAAHSGLREERIQRRGMVEPPVVSGCCCCCCLRYLNSIPSRATRVPECTGKLDEDLPYRGCPITKTADGVCYRRSQGRYLGRTLAFRVSHPQRRGKTIASSKAPWYPPAASTETTPGWVCKCWISELGTSHPKPQASFSLYLHRKAIQETLVSS